MVKNKKEEIRRLVKVSVLISVVSKEKILQKIDSLDEGQLDALLLLLTDAETNQERLIKKVLEVHPDFLDYLEKFQAREIDKMRKEAESKSQYEDRQKMSNLDEMLEKI